MNKEATVYENRNSRAETSKLHIGEHWLMQLNNLFRRIHRVILLFFRILSNMQVAKEKKKGWWIQKASIIKEHVIMVKQESWLIARFRFTKVNYVATRQHRYSRKNRALIKIKGEKNFNDFKECWRTISAFKDFFPSQSFKVLKVYSIIFKSI